MSRYVLLSWVAVQNDPFECERMPRTGEPRQRRMVRGAPVPGPTLTLLFDETSPYRGKITDAVFFRQGGLEAAFHQSVYEELSHELGQRLPELRLHSRTYPGDDPTDHGAIFEFLRIELPQLRRKFAGQNLVLHVSPGTPSMHTVWVLMAETGFIHPPLELVKSYRLDERRGRPAVVPVHLGIETYYKRYVEEQPHTGSPPEQTLRWDPSRFRSETLRRLFSEGQRVARLRVPVLILGERGTGKTTLAAWIRSASPYRKAASGRDWPAVACGQYTTETMRAELFGYVKGAFTGALHSHDGLLKRADGETLFLDEIGDVSRDMQRLLLKAVEEGCFQPLGSTDLIRARFRLLCATNLPLQALRERLDADFLDRISAFVLQVPALREIPEELDWLWDDVLAEAAVRAEIPKSYLLMGVEARARLLRALRAHPLPGNLRDLFQVAWRLLAARADPENPLALADAVEYALAGLGAEPTAAAAATQAQRIAQAFAESRPLDAELDMDAHGRQRLDTRALLDALRAYLAGELRRVAHQRGVPVESLADVSERALRQWVRKKAATARKKHAGKPRSLRTRPRG